ncbi:hypothetical protein BT69DRAFT_892142 [Atractiella rhizophila]|nr:hypothetical protein BT69DRAFT_892142 [Atractiella rhizophila]
MASTGDIDSGKSKRKRTEVDLAVKNNEDGTAMSEAKRRRTKKVENSTIPDYNKLQLIFKALPRLQRDPNHKTSALFRKLQPLIGQADNVEEDVDEPIHRAFSLWSPTSLLDIGGFEGVRALQDLWRALLKVTPLPPNRGPLEINARKAAICAGAARVHFILVQEGLADDVGDEEGSEFELEEEEVSLEDKEVDPREIENEDIVLAMEENDKVAPEKKGKKSGKQRLRQPESKPTTATSTFQRVPTPPPPTADDNETKQSEESCLVLLRGNPEEEQKDGVEVSRCEVLPLLVGIPVL